MVAALEAAKRKEQEAILDEYDEQLVKAKKLSEFSEKLRHAILAGEDVSKTWRPAAMAATLRAQREGSPGATTSPVRASQNQLQDTAATVDVRKSKEDKDAGVPEPAAAKPSAAAAAPTDVKPKLAAPAAPATAAAAAVTADDAAEKQLQKEMEDLVESALAGASLADAQPPAAAAAAVATPVAAPAAAAAAAATTPRQAPKSASAAAPSSSKPAWALTADEAQAVEEDEEAELLAFVNDLDVDSFLSDLDDVTKIMAELEEQDKAKGEVVAKESAAYKARLVRAMNDVALRKAQAAGQARRAAADAMSIAGRSDAGESTISKGTFASQQRLDAAAARRAELAERAVEPDWDASTRAGDDVGKGLKVAAAHQAEDFLRENPELKSVHSIASVRSMLTKVQQQEQQDAASGKGADA